ncbi:hypothetical protein HMPREF1039_0827 [Megasphaera lornae]|uniref:Uncharacterized protein n=1 Tax=Megasphaera lornae TaxID=1000568 RepID=D3LT74_9FIRM|nr:hypothetical protein HMPREF0889_0060 [Megasphaera genomosp. type_1 str. 28L]EGL42372.1 hypothetical protein HMPREF1039_0827 [Megasphaera lornae]MUP50303.1 hypothetical protein [Veillonellaceae bacterium M1-70]
MICIIIIIGYFPYFSIPSCYYAIIIYHIILYYANLANARYYICFPVICRKPLKTGDKERQP